MDCEKLDTIAIDIVDPSDEGDVVDARWVRERREAEEHLAGCSRCTAVIERLRGGMRAASQLELEDPSSMLEARILAAARAVPRDVSLRRRVTRAISTAGSWAMRPQVAMAAVLVVMVGTSIVLLRGNSAPTARNTKVTEEGTPVSTLDPQPEQQGAPAIIGAGEKKNDQGVAAKEPPKEPPKEATKLEEKPALVAEVDKNAGGESEKKKMKDEAPADDLAAGGAKAQPMAPPPAPPPAAAPPAGFGGVAGGKDNESVALGKKTAGAPGAGAAAGPMPAPTTAPAQPAQTTTPSTSTSYDDAMTAYKASKWSDAAKGFDASVASGTKVSSSLLYSARSYRAAGSCAQALPRYQKLVNGYASSAEAPHGAIEGGQCAKGMSDVATARALFEKAKGYPVTQKQAEAELAALDKPTANAPVKAKAAKPSTAVDSAY